MFPISSMKGEKNKRKAMNRKFKEETLTSRRETEKRRRSARVCRRNRNNLK
jgi:hypothetical protein